MPPVVQRLKHQVTYSDALGPCHISTMGHQTLELMHLRLGIPDASFVQLHLGYSNAVVLHCHGQISGGKLLTFIQYRECEDLQPC